MYEKLQQKIHKLLYKLHKNIKYDVCKGVLSYILLIISDINSRKFPNYEPELQLIGGVFMFLVIYYMLKTICVLLICMLVFDEEGAGIIYLYFKSQLLKLAFIFAIFSK